MYLVDTNVLSEARRGRAEAASWLRSVDPDQIFLSVITLGEIMKGIAMKSRSDVPASAALHRWLETLRSAHARRILPINSDVAVQWGRIAALRPRSVPDALIAATAIAHNKILVTRNIGDFADLPVVIIDPWKRDNH
jgi:predicted nucleic acid-binding protein